MGKASGKIDSPLGWFRSGMKLDCRPQRSLFDGTTAVA
jgi:hypothetical protein